jgi:demethylmenaquinone methyltransferase/2-methoxy-6-polyprenyl-1,4-benzoquinol methylase
VKAYYDRRAPESDDWYLRRGRWTDVEPDGWQEELDALGATLRRLSPARTLDGACGTGFMTCRLRGDVTAPDQSARMLDIARERLPAATLVHGDALALPFEQWQAHVLNDGSEWSVFKRYFTPRRLLDELGGGEVLHAGRWFVAVASP